MEFDPKSEQQIRNEMCMTPGEYDFEVADAVEKVSAKGNPMIELTLRIFTPSGSVRVIKDWLVPTMELKLNRFSRATGLWDVSQGGTMDDLAIKGVSGRCVLTIKSSEQFGDQNAVKDYIPTDTTYEATEAVEEPAAVLGVSGQQTKKAMANAVDDDGIPF